MTATDHNDATGEKSTETAAVEKDIGAAGVSHA